MTSPTGPVYLVRTPRLVIRCWNPADAPLLKVAIDESLEHLRPWMPWIRNEPEDLDAKVERLRHFRADFDLGKDFFYGIFTPDERAVLGGTGLHTRIGEGAREIGYWIHAHHTGQGLATETAGALTRVGFEIDRLVRIEIHCDPANARSAKVPARLGYSHEATLGRRGRSADGEPRDEMIWSMFEEDYRRSPVRDLEVEAFDAMGRALILSGATARA